MFRTSYIDGSDFARGLTKNKTIVCFHLDLAEVNNICKQEISKLKERGKKIVKKDQLQKIWYVSARHY